MMQSSCDSFQFRRCRLTSLAKRFRTLLLIAFTACAGLSLTRCASAKEAKGFAPATLVEAADYLPCANGCSALVDPASAFCFRLGDQVLVGEGRSYLHQSKFSSMEELAGMRLEIRFNRRSIWIRPPDRAPLKIKRGSRFENFKDAGCIREVHRPILAVADASKRPAKVPAEAFALPGSGKGDLFLWYQCALEPDTTVIACRRWYRNGDAYGKDWYCAQTLDGTPVGAVATLDPLLSQEGRLVLKSGAVLRRDNRARTNDMLDRPSEACR
jgi:hypothetical protein